MKNIQFIQHIILISFLYIMPPIRAMDQNSELQLSSKEISSMSSSSRQNKIPRDYDSLFEDNVSLVTENEELLNKYNELKGQNTRLKYESSTSNLKELQTSLNTRTLKLEKLEQELENLKQELKDSQESKNKIFHLTCRSINSLTTQKNILIKIISELNSTPYHGHGMYENSPTLEKMPELITDFEETMKNYLSATKNKVRSLTSSLSFQRNVFLTALAASWIIFIYLYIKR